MADEATAAKNRGNAAFQKGDFETAVTEFTSAIEHDASNHVFFSNRSGAYASLGKFEEALADAKSCTSIKPDWSKGFSRTGFAHMKLKQFDEADAAYNKGLEVEPGNAPCTQGLKDVEAAQKPSGMGSLFGPDMWGKLAADPTTREYLNDPTFVQKLKMMQANPNSFGSALGGMGQDPRMSAALGVILGLGSSGFSTMNPKDGSMGDDDTPMADAKRAATAAADEDDEPHYEEEEDEVDMEWEAEKKRKKEALEMKDQGNTHYKKKEFEKALECYNKAIELDPENVSFKTNKAAVYFETKEYEKCIETCQEAINEAKANKGYDYKMVSKAYFRMGNAYDKMDKMDEAIANYDKCLMEDPLPAAKAGMKKLKEKKQRLEKEAYLDKDKSEEHKGLGNEHFKAGKWIAAIDEYSEALKRDPSNYKVYSNRAACYTKLMDWQRGMDDCEACLAMDPLFVKAYIRKGKIQHFLKQYHKALETFQKGLDLDPKSTELKDGKKMTMQAINQENSSGNVDPARAQEAMKDPEIQAILQDPMINNILRNMQTDPASGQRAMADPTIRAKIEKLIAAGVLQVA